MCLKKEVSQEVDVAITPSKLKNGNQLRKRACKGKACAKALAKSAISDIDASFSRLPLPGISIGHTWMLGGIIIAHLWFRLL